jgi:alpha-maltose-1-phosphate synthase
MKVTLFTREYPPFVYGGAGIHVKFLSKELQKLMEVDVRCFGDQDVAEKNLRVRGYKPWEKLKDRQKFSAVLETLSVNLLSLCDDFDSDVVHSHTWYGHYAGLLAKNLYQVPFVATCHSLEPLRHWKGEQLSPGGYQLSTWAEKVAVEGADKIIAVSTDMKADILKYFNVLEDRVVVIHNGIDPDLWKRTPLSDEMKRRYPLKDDYILYLGRTTQQKGIEYLIEAADQIPCQIVLCAVGADTKEYEKLMTEKAKTKKNILWIHEMLKEEESIQLFSGARAFVCPSIYEPFGITNLEAMACKTPVVASAVGGILEVVVPGETGLLVKPGDPGEIAGAVKRLLQDSKTAVQYGENGRKRVEQYFSWTSIAEKTRDLYKSLVH